MLCPKLHNHHLEPVGSERHGAPVRVSDFTHDHEEPLREISEGTPYDLEILRPVRGAEHECEPAVLRKPEAGPCVGNGLASSASRDRDHGRLEKRGLFRPCVRPRLAGHTYAGDAIPASSLTLGASGHPSQSSPRS